MNTRRKILAGSAKVAALLAGAGLLPGLARAQAAGPWNQAAFEAKTLAELTKVLGTAAPSESRDVTVTGPDIAENGAFVPIGAATTLPNAKRLLVLVEKNPNLLSAAFDLNGSIEPSFSTRVKMSQSSDVYAVVLTSDNRVLYARKDIKVTLGGCAG